MSDKLFEDIEISEETKAILAERFQNETKGLVENKNAILAERKAIEEKYKNDSELLNSYKQKEEEMKDKEMMDKGEFEKLLNEKISKHQNSFNEYKNSVSEKEKQYNNQLSEYQNKIYSMQLKDQISKVALSDEHFDKNEGSIELLEMLASKSFKTDEKGNFKYVDDTKLDSNGNPIDFKSWFNETVKTKHKNLFKGAGGAGLETSRGSEQQGKFSEEQISRMSLSDYKKAKKEGLI